jgi:hypothetical protein
VVAFVEAAPAVVGATGLGDVFGLNKSPKVFFAGEGDGVTDGDTPGIAVFFRAPFDAGSTNGWVVGAGETLGAAGEATVAAAALLRDFLAGEGDASAAAGEAPVAGEDSVVTAAFLRDFLAGEADGDGDSDWALTKQMPESANIKRRERSFLLMASRLMKSQPDWKVKTAMSSRGFPPVSLGVRGHPAPSAQARSIKCQSGFGLVLIRNRGIGASIQNVLLGVPEIYVRFIHLRALLLLLLDRSQVAGSVRSSFANQGQICLCGSRVFVERSAYKNFVDRFIDKASKLKIGDPLDDVTVSSSNLGPEPWYRAGFTF